ncbi:unnamed protein product [Heterosigma akashiwo]|uniref:Uncharacterized protein n=1 Tax=Heterosigma akashiwo TaxID=2829 RepID=A0A6V1P4C5_HETAK
MAPSILGQAFRKSALKKGLSSAAPLLRPYARASIRGLKKNAFVEEWNGKREITEQTFTYTGQTTRSLLMWMGVFPAFVYVMTKGELEKRDASKGKRREYM